MRADRGEDVGEAGGEGQAAGGDHRSLADPPAEPARGQGEGGRHQRAGGEGEAGLQRRVAPDLGQQQDAGEQHRPEAGEEDRGGEVGEREGADPQQRQLDHRRVVVGRAAQEGDDQCQRAATKAATVRGSAQPQSVPLTMPRVSRPMPSASSAAPSRSGRPSSGSRTSSSGADRDDRGEHPDRDVDDEDPAPAELHEQAADRRAERRRDAADGRPDADRRRPLLGREGGQDQAQRGRQHHRPAGRLQDPGARPGRGSRARRRRAPRRRRRAAGRRRRRACGRPGRRSARRGRAAPRRRSRRRSAPRRGWRARRRRSRRAMSGKAMLTMKRSRLAMNRPTEVIARTFQRCSIRPLQSCGLQFASDPSRA